MNWICQYDSKKYIKERESYIEARGGDGTLIKAIQMFKDKKKPFFGTAGGTENFLMNPEGFIEKKASYVNFNMIKVEVIYLDENNNEKVEVHQAFNDIIIGEFNAWIDFNCQHEDNILGSFKGAALLISTSQGSTGANKNNRGTILPLSSKQWSITSVMTNRHINYVLSPKELNVKCSTRERVKVAIDGSYVRIKNVISVKLTKGEKVTVIFNNYKRFKEKRQ
jgi:NAD kinase